MNLKLKDNVFTYIYFILISIILFGRTLINTHVGHLDSTLLYIRVLNILLSYLALSGIYVIYNKNKNSTIFLLGLMYLCLSLDIIDGNIDYFIFNNDKFSFSNYINILPSILRMFLLVISLYPDNKIHKFIFRQKTKSVIFVITFSFLSAIFKDVLHLNILGDIKYAFVIYNIILIILYIFSAVKLWDLAKRNTFVLRYLSIGLVLLIVKALYAIHGYFYVDFNIKLISVSMTSLFFITMIFATGVKLYITSNQYHYSNNELMKFFNFVENNKYSSMFICDYDFNISYINKKIEEYYNFEDPLNQFKKDAMQNECLFSKLKYIIKDLDTTGHWSGIIEDYNTNEILDCYVQRLDIDSKNKQVLVSYIDIRGKIDLQKKLEDTKLREVKKDEFISNISHELKTPLNIFYSTLQLLESYSENDEVDFKKIFFKHNNSLRLNCKRMIRLINNIVDISRIDLGVLKPDYGNYNIVLLTEDIIDSIIPFAMSKSLTLEFDTNSEEHYIMCDPLIIERILLNLLSNSIKYSDRNSSIYVLLTVEEDVTKISIRDEGCGINLNNNTDIFDRFTRIDDSFTRLNEGSGIGLSIVKSMLDLIGAKVTVESEVGIGSTFEISLPNKLIESEENKNYIYESNHNISIELSDIYEIN